METQFIETLRPYLRGLADGEPIEPEHRLHDLGLDSMQAIELLFALEDGYDIALTEDELTEGTFETAGSLWLVVAGARGRGAVTR
ncbi:acyl carrier protein [Actinokineospora sp. UTMC 2448]|uniref:acyl carrier protein n=1 Tax=Actinokineospora sp. UTMC 2448 TaxID=2268449 RepID=UPI0021642454|nr:acyl carrier protein [Actinokineospora sp. UTMC 2448]UVS79496.1 Aminoacyl carrier protein 2 [Actinokineospora sp. UTMC 2448]